MMISISAMEDTRSMGSRPWRGHAHTDTSDQSWAHFLQLCSAAEERQVSLCSMLLQAVGSFGVATSPLESGRSQEVPLWVEMRDPGAVTASGSSPPGSREPDSTD